MFSHGARSLEPRMRRMEALGEVAERYHRVEPDVPASYFRQQLKHYVQVGLIAPRLHQGTGRTAAGLFAERETCAAYVLSALTRLGLRADQLKAFAHDRWRREFEGVLGAIGDGGRRLLILEIGSWAKGEDARTPPVIAEFRERADVTRDASHRNMIVVLDCTRLLRPLLEDMAAHEEPPATARRGRPRRRVITGGSRDVP
jgi:hypothetical protein